MIKSDSKNLHCYNFFFFIKILKNVSVSTKLLCSTTIVYTDNINNIDNINIDHMKCFLSTKSAY